jgi:hypothetical protein
MSGPPKTDHSPMAGAAVGGVPVPSVTEWLVRKGKGFEATVPAPSMTKWRDRASEVRRIHGGST